MCRFTLPSCDDHSAALGPSLQQATSSSVWSASHFLLGLLLDYYNFKRIWLGAFGLHVSPLCLDWHCRTWYVDDLL